jgi:hypothetical protein
VLAFEFFALVAEVEVARVVDAELDEAGVECRSPLVALHEQSGVRHAGESARMIEVEVAHRRMGNRRRVDIDGSELRSEDATLVELDVEERCNLAQSGGGRDDFRVHARVEHQRPARMLDYECGNRHAHAAGLTGDHSSRVTFQPATLEGSHAQRHLLIGTEEFAPRHEGDQCVSVEPPLETPVRLRTHALVGCDTLLARIPEYNAGALR